MKHDGDFNTDANHFVFKDIGKIFCQFLWINDFHVSMGWLGDLTNDFHFASLTFDSHDVDR